MSNHHDDRAEARRRARRAARGEQDDEATSGVEEPAEPQRDSWLRRLFPPAPPLPGKPPPLEGFTYVGRLRPVVERLWLLGRMPLAWLVPAVIWFLGQQANQSTLPGFLISFLGFGAPLAAGWFGWRRPQLYGAASSILGFLILAGFFGVVLATQELPVDAPSSSEIALFWTQQGVLYGVMGYLLGWYGGYLRRRQASVPRTASGRRR